MPKLRIVTDSDCDLPRAILERFTIPSFPMAVHFGARRYWDGVDLDVEGFYRQLAGSDHPRTDHPDPEEMRRVYLDLARDGSQILSVHVSHRLSETVSIARGLAAELRGQADIEVVDTLAASLAQGLQVLRAAIMAEGGTSRAQIVSVLQNLISQTNSVIAINDLDHLARGGRLNRAQALIGTVIGLKPIISLTEQGTLALVGRAHGWERAVKHILDWVEARITYPREHWLGIVHSRLPGEAERLAGILAGRYAPREIVLSEIGPTIGAHIGPGALGVAFNSERGRG